MMQTEQSILLIDDDPTLLKALHDILAEVVPNVVSATSAEEALHHLLVYDFDAILLDMKLPDIDGAELIGLIRERERYARIPIILVTGRDLTRQAAEDYQREGIEYLRKPFTAEDLLDKVAAVLKE